LVGKDLHTGAWRPLVALTSEELRGDDGVSCTVFNVASIAACAGYRSVDYFETKVLTQPFFHSVPIKTLTGKVIGRATTPTSAQAGGEMARAAGLVAKREGLKQFQVTTRWRKE
jgi:hypothetical protein